MITPHHSILFIASGSGLAGGERNLLDIAEYLVAGGRWRVSAAVPADGALKERLEALGCDVAVVPLSGFALASSIMAIKRIIRAGKVDIVHAHGTRAAFYARPAARLAGAPCVYTVHGMHYLHYSPAKRAVFLMVERLMRRWQAKVIFVCEADMEEGVSLRVASPGGTRVIYNGVPKAPQVPAGERDRLRKEFGAATSDTVALSVGRFHRQKGQRYLLEAAASLAGERPDIKFVLAGGGDSLEAMKKLAGVAKNVVFLGPRDDIPALMTAADIFVLPSLWEGLPYVLLEAAGRGLPIVASEVDGVVEVIRNGETGRLVPPGDSVALARAVAALVDDKDSAAKFAGKARALVEDNFSLESMNRTTEELYLEIVEDS